MRSQIRIFVSSPSDVLAERLAVYRVAKRVSAQFEGVSIDVYLWEKDHYYSAHTGFQEQIEEIARFDLVVGILWSRIGSPLPPNFGGSMPVPREGQPYPSGTAFEILEAIRLRRERDAPPPEIFLYRKWAPTPSAPADDDAAHAELDAQRKALRAFINDYLVDEREGFKAAFHSFQTLDDFDAQFEADLIAWLRAGNRLGRQRRWRVEDPERGCPFVGLNAFGPKYREVFFGRRADVERARERLESGNGFLLIDGASGTGKSSLVRAGLLPRLRDLDPDLRVSVAVPETADPLAALAQALFDEEALPELAQSDYPDPAALARHFAGGGDASPVFRALDRAAKALTEAERRDSPADLRLVLVVDQFEALFTTRVSRETRSAYASLLAQLVDSGRVRVIATLRANAREAALSLPALGRLINGQMGLSLEPPGPDAMAEIIRGPAEAAALDFERNAEGVGLDEVLMREVEKDPAALPLLQFALEKLYDAAAKRVTDAAARLGDVPEEAPVLTLTHADYRALGGLAGAIGHQAEAALKNCSQASQSRLAPLVRALTEAGSGTFVLARAPLAQAAPDAETQELAEALIAARIIVQGSERDSDTGRIVTTLRLSHERVLTVWDRAKDAVQAAAGYLRIRADLTRAEARWRKAGRNADLLLPRGVRLAEAEEALRDFGQELDRQDPRLRAYVQNSGRHARRRQRLTQTAAAIFALVALAAGLFAYQNDQNARLAAANETTALANEATANANAKEAAENARNAAAEAKRAEDNARLADAERNRAEANAARAEAAARSAAAAARRSQYVVRSVLAERGMAQFKSGNYIEALQNMERIANASDSTRDLLDIATQIRSAELLKSVSESDLEQVPSLNGVAEGIFPNEGKRYFAVWGKAVHVVDSQERRVVYTFPDIAFSLLKSSILYQDGGRRISVVRTDTKRIFSFDTRTGMATDGLFIPGLGLTPSSVHQSSADDEATIVTGEGNGGRISGVKFFNGTWRSRIVHRSGRPCTLVAEFLRGGTERGETDRYYYCPFDNIVVRNPDAANQSAAVMFDLQPLPGFRKKEPNLEYPFLGQPKIRLCGDRQHVLIGESSLTKMGAMQLYRSDGTALREIRGFEDASQVACFTPDAIMFNRNGSIVRDCSDHLIGCKRPLFTPPSEIQFIQYQFAEDGAYFWIDGKFFRLNYSLAPITEHAFVEQQIIPLVVEIGGRPHVVLPPTKAVPRSVLLTGNDNQIARVDLDLAPLGAENYALEYSGRRFRDGFGSDIIASLKPPSHDERKPAVSYCQRLLRVKLPTGQIAAELGFPRSYCSPKKRVSYVDAILGNAVEESFAIGNTIDLETRTPGKQRLFYFRGDDEPIELAEINEMASPTIITDRARSTALVCDMKNAMLVDLLEKKVVIRYGEKFLGDGSGVSSIDCRYLANGLPYIRVSKLDRQSRIIVYSAVARSALVDVTRKYLPLRFGTDEASNTFIAFEPSPVARVFSVTGLPFEMPGIMDNGGLGFTPRLVARDGKIITIEPGGGFYIGEFETNSYLFYDTAERYKYLSFSEGGFVVAITVEGTLRIFRPDVLAVDLIDYFHNLFQTDPRDGAVVDKLLASLSARAIYSIAVDPPREVSQVCALFDDVVREARLWGHATAGKGTTAADLYAVCAVTARGSETHDALVRFAEAASAVGIADLRLRRPALFLKALVKAQGDKDADPAQLERLAVIAERMVAATQPPEITSGLARVVGSLSYHSILIAEDALAERLANIGIAADQRQDWIYGNLAHAFMYLGQSEASLAIHRRMKSKTITLSGRPLPWKDMVAEDFEELRKAGRPHELMAEITNMLEAGGR